VIRQAKRSARCRLFGDGGVGSLLVIDSRRTEKEQACHRPLCQHPRQISRIFQVGRKTVEVVAQLPLNGCERNYCCVWRKKRNKTFRLLIQGKIQRRQREANQFYVRSDTLKFIAEVRADEAAAV